MLNKFIAAVFALAAAFSACAATSGPTYNVLDIQLPNGQKAFKAECYGVFTSSSSCMAAAQKVCGNQPVNLLQTLDGTNVTNPREVIFNCSAPQPPAPAVVTPEPQPAPAPAPEPKHIVLGEKTNFDFDSAVLKPNGKRILDKIIADSNGATYASVKVAGYTDSTGADAYNVRLSERRAQSVISYLKAHGMKSNEFTAQGFGKSNPVASNATSAGRAENRRVDIALTP